MGKGEANSTCVILLLENFVHSNSRIHDVEEETGSLSIYKYSKSSHH